VFHPRQDVNTTGTANIALALGRIRAAVDECIGMQGFVCFHSYEGGADSGFSDRALLDVWWPAVGKVTAKSRQQVSMAMVGPYKNQSHPNQPFVRFVVGDDDDLLQRS
jgi:hypothetical protein